MWHSKRSFSLLLTITILLLMVTYNFIKEGFGEMSILSLITRSAILLVLILTIVDYFRKQNNSAAEKQATLYNVVLYVFCIAISIFFLISEGIQILSLTQLVVVSIMIIVMAAIVVRYCSGLFKKKNRSNKLYD